MSFVLFRLRIIKPVSLLKAFWLFLFLICGLFMITSCSEENETAEAFLLLKTGTAYTANEAFIPTGGTIKIGIQASGAGVPLTYLRIDRITANDTITQVDRGMYVGSEGYDADFTFAKDTASVELWTVLVMNADRDTAVASLVVHKGSGSAYGEINYYDPITIGLQDNNSIGHFLDVHSGQVYDNQSVTGHESKIDIISYFYITSGLPSPTFTCPGYTSAVGYYPELADWPVKNSILYDYYSSDNNLISAEQFDQATNDSLLVNAYKPEKVSGNCKYGYTGKIIPFKTEEGKYGLIRVIEADETETGKITLAIKIQK